MKKFLYKVNSDAGCGPCTGIMRLFLWLLSLAYSVTVKLVYLCYAKGLLKKYNLGKPVISVGNLTVGGVGKTPLVILIAKYLQQKGIKPVILTRGYMDKDSNKGLLSDEAEMLKQELKDIPILVGPDRVKNARNFMKCDKADVFILDDGFQHWKIARDIDVVVIDSKNPFGKRNLIPRGILREPISSLKRAGVFVLSKVDKRDDRIIDLVAELKDICPETLIVESSHRPIELIDLKTDRKINNSDIVDKKICSFCSIGDPGSFENTLFKIGIKTIKNYSFVDHYQYNTQDLSEIVSFCKENKIKDLITTQKDAVKIMNRLGLFEGVNIYSLRIEIELGEGKEHFFERIDSVL